MKNMNYIFWIFVLLIFETGLIHSQVVVDPVTNVYKIGGTSELYISYTNSDQSFSYNGILDIPESLNFISSVEDPLPSRYMDIYRNATAVGDFNGDGADDVVCIRDNTSGGIKITIPLIGADLTNEGEKTYYDEDMNTSGYERIRICSGNFDDDPADEFVICYGMDSDNPVVISLYETDADLNIRFVDTYQSIVYKDHNFDIAAGDMDGDGIDEIVFVKNMNLPHEEDCYVNPPVFVSDYSLYILEYDYNSEELIQKAQKTNIQLDNEAESGDYYPDYSMVMNEMRVSCGDINNDATDEIFVGWSVYYSYLATRYCSLNILGVCLKYSYYYDYRDMVFLNSFGLENGNEITNYQNLCVTHSDFGRREVNPDQHITLSLKCDQLDNVGGAEVLVSGSTEFCVYSTGGQGMELEKRLEMDVPGNLNITGSENFIVADFNPDTINMDFNKEVIMLKSNKAIVDQINNAAGEIPALEIYSIDSIASDYITFKPPDPEHSIPFSDIQDIELSAFFAGDFDLDQAEVYLVGIPEVIPVSEFQQPLIILNAPPVHFDVFDGINYDICDAFLNDDDPAFNATYNTVIEEQNTTSVAVDNSFGFSSRLSSYAMAGGSGFEASVESNWESGQSFYQSKSQDKIIEEAKSIYTEDFVLYSSLDYTYYRYPVYNSAYEIIGHIAVLNPNSENFVSVWGSGNNWDHPSYIFNHEPGNLLSYKAFKNSTDFCGVTSEFLSCEYSKVPVTHTGDGSFNFTYDNISSGGSSYSFSAGVGADLFTKVGIEGSATLELGFLGIGGSVSTDYRIGVSSELSSFFSTSSLTTHNTTLRNTFQIDGNIGRLNESYDNVARYFITPYIYRSQSGALVLDYMVELDENNMDWWTEYYGQDPDLAFILPWRYAAEKGAENTKESKKQQTNEIQFYKPIVLPGDTVCITARVHNYSLKTFSGDLKVDFYLDEPGNGGVLLEDIYGYTGVTKSSTMIYGADDPGLDFEEYLCFNWEVPDTISCSHRIYAVIDPEDEYSEIHENNNIAWNVLNIFDCEDCQYKENTGTEDFKANSFRLEAWPNPFYSSTTFSFSLEVPQHVKIEIYNISGKKTGIITDQYYPQGDHKLGFTADHLTKGIYICKFAAGNYSATKKLILLK